MTFADRIKTAREHAKLSRDELADAVGCSYDLLRKLEAGLRSSTSFLSKIAKTCQVNFNWLETGDGQMLEISYITSETPEAQLFKVMQNMDAATKYQLVKIGITLAEPAEKPNGTLK